MKNTVLSGLVALSLMSFAPEAFSQPRKSANTRKASTTERVSGVSKSAEANINRGNWLTGGQVSMTQTWFRNSDQFNLLINAPVQYFIWNRFAVGGQFVMTHNSGDTAGQTNFALGPAATWYFWAKERWAAYWSEALLFNFFEDFDDTASIASIVGVNYFFTPSVAFGPALNFTHVFGFGNRSDVNQLSLAASFTVHL